MIRYNVRSRYLVDLINEVRDEKLILAPYFQRKLVWRDAHKVDFIKTILLGFPFPEIFISRGTIDLQSMQSTSSLVDGQQRMSTIKEFIEDRFAVDGKKYSQMSPSEKESLLKYEIAIIDLDLQQDDPRIIDVFKRLNRTFYALSMIEKLSTEYGSSDFMLIAKLLAGELKEDMAADEPIGVDRHKDDPNITEAFTEWARKQKVQSYTRLALDSTMFSKHEVARQVHLMFTLNIMATLLDGYYNRNDSATRYLDSKADNFPERQSVIEQIENAASVFNRMRLPAGSFWYGKSNAFSLTVSLAQTRVEWRHVDLPALRSTLIEFGKNPPQDYALAAKEGVNNKKERLLRSTYVKELLRKYLPQQESNT